MRNVSDKIYRDAEDTAPSKREELTHDPEDIHPQPNLCGNLKSREVF